MTLRIVKYPRTANAMEIKQMKESLDAEVVETGDRFFIIPDDYEITESDLRVIVKKEKGTAGAPRYRAMVEWDGGKNNITLDWGASRERILRFAQSFVKGLVGIEVEEVDE